MTHFVVIYASREGQTQKIAHHVAKQIENLGHTSRLINVGDDEPDALLGDFDAAVIAGNMDSAERASALGEYVKEHKDALKSVPSALLSVTLPGGAPDRDSQAEAKAELETFENYSGWRPSRALPVGGAVVDRSRGSLRRTLLHFWMRLKGITPDASGYTELTDWPGLEEFVRSFAAEASTARKEAPAPAPVPEAAPPPPAETAPPAAKPARKKRQAPRKKAAPKSKGESGSAK